MILNKPNQSGENQNIKVLYLYYPISCFILTLYRERNFSGCSSDRLDTPGIAVSEETILFEYQRNRKTRHIKKKKKRRHGKELEQLNCNPSDSLGRVVPKMLELDCNLKDLRLLPETLHDT